MPASGQSALIFHSTMDGAQDLFQPSIARATFSTMDEAIRSPERISWVQGKFGMATKFTIGSGAWDGYVHLRGENLDLVDPEQDGGRLDMWIRFDVDPHSTRNVFVMSEWTGTRNFNLELAGSPSGLMADLYGDIPHSERANFLNFRVHPRYVPVWENIAAGEWHLYTWRWRYNGGEHRDELHYYIDGVHVGSDFNGNLPRSQESFPYLALGSSYEDGMAMTIDEIYSFDSWDVSEVSGNFADIQIPEGVTLTYPMDARTPIWAYPIPEGVTTFEFYVVDDVNAQTPCDVYVDGAKSGSVTTTSETLTAYTHPTPLDIGTHTFQVKCDGDRLVSSMTQFEVEAGLQTETTTMGGFKGRFPRQ